jgi:hypothetical protein
MTQELHPHQLLSDLMALPGHPGVYVLGSFARHVTIYSQQVRAVNLVDALFRTGQLGRGTPVAVVGAGAAGLTAAAAAAWRGARVTVIEKEQSYLSIQRHSDKRFVHPHIYDWPLHQAPGDEDLAEVPFLPWRADTARRVFEGMEKDWNAFVQMLPAGQAPRQLRGTFTGLECAPDGVRLRITPGNAGGPDTRTAQVAILALGFGLEEERGNYGTYWQDTGLDFTAGGGKHWLVSGFGDGALTDLLGLCIIHFEHKRFVQRFAGNARLAGMLRDLLADPGEGSGGIRAAFQALNRELGADAFLEPGEIREKVIVTFNASPDYLESSGSSILNRFLAFQLEERKAFHLQPGYVLDIPNPVNDRVAIDFWSDKQRTTHLAHDEFDRLVIRHGPAPALKDDDFPELAAALRTLRGRWADQSQAHDATRVPRWDPREYDTAAEPQRPPRPDPAGNLLCFVLTSTADRAHGPLPELVEGGVLSNAAEIHRQTGSLAPPEFAFTSAAVNESLRDQEEYDRTVRLLCTAEVAVVDVTGFEPGIMLFLGIRAAARRGVTVVTTNGTLGVEEWARLPFNLKELFPLSLLPRTPDVNSPEHPGNLLGGTVARALGQYRLEPTYQDLPAYEAVRRHGTPASSLGGQTVLWLCSFGAAYQPCEAYLQNGFNAQYGGKLDPGGTRSYRLERITDIPSPQLVAQRLYGSLRHSGLCLVDWTFWSPNVFFELGVRLAVSDMGWICLIASEMEGVADGDAPDAELAAQRAALTARFAPIPYGARGESRALFQEVERRHDQMNTHATRRGAAAAVPPTFGAQPFNHTHRLVGRHLPLRNEPGAAPAHEFLQAAAHALVGISPTSTQQIPVLYAGVREELADQARRAATELRLAAWFYLEGRYPVRALRADPALAAQAAQLGNGLVASLSLSPDPEDLALVERIETILNALERADEEVSR